MKYSTIGLESSFLNDIVDFTSNIFKSKDPSKEIEISFKNSEKNIKEDKSVSTTKLSIFNNIITKLTLWNYNNKIKSSISQTYVKEIEATEGYYSKRSNLKTQKSVYDMFDFISNNYKKSTYNTIFDLYIRLFNLLIRSRYAMDMFNTSYKYKSKGSDNFSIIYIEYVMMVFTLEYLTLALSEYVLKMNTLYSFNEVNKDFCNKYSSFVMTVCKNIIKILVKYESIKDMKKYTLSMIENEKKNSGSESEIFGKIDNTTSKESLLVTSLIVAGKVGLAIAGVIAAISVIRYVIYYLSCLKVDITKSLEEQSNLLLINISTLENKLSTMKVGSKEYINLEKVIEKQKKYTQIVIEIAKKLSDNDISSINDIRDSESDDNDDIKDTLNSESDDNSSKDFDI